MVIEKSDTVNPPPGSWVLLARNLGGSWTTLYHQDVRIDKGDYKYLCNWEDTTSPVDVSKQNFYDEYAMVILALQASVRDDELYNGMAPGVRRIYFTGVSIWDSATTDISCECKDGFFNSPVVAGSGGPGQGDCIPWQECDADTQVTDFPGSKTRNRDCKCKAGHSRETQAAVSCTLTEICDPCV